MYSFALLLGFGALCLALTVYGLIARAPFSWIMGLLLLLVWGLIFWAMRYPPVYGMAV